MKYLYFIVPLIILFSCTKKENSQTKIQKQIVSENTINNQSDYMKIDINYAEGDFDGDGNKEKLVSFISDSTGKAIDSIPTGNDWGETLDYAFGIGLTTTIYIEGKKTDTLKLGTSMGVYCLINLGDMNNDKKDEVILVANWPDYSNLNTARVYSLCYNKWKEIKTFGVNEGIAFDWEGDKRPTYKDIPGFLKHYKGKWIIADYNDEDYNGQVENMKPLLIPNCNFSHKK